jgi:copper chaperone CopZ
MKQRLQVILGLILLAVAMVACRRHDFREITIHVPQMRNSACVKVIASGFSRAPGIKRESLRFDLEKRTITLEYDSILTADKNIEFYVAKTGFSANGIPADAKAAASLPPECLQ